MDNVDMPTKIEPGRVIDIIMLNGKMVPHYHEDGPYFPKYSKPWITCANDEGEVISAEWNQDKCAWCELK